MLIFTILKDIPVVHAAVFHVLNVFSVVADMVEPQRNDLRPVITDLRPVITDLRPVITDLMSSIVNIVITM